MKWWKFLLLSIFIHLLCIQNTYPGVGKFVIKGGKLLGKNKKLKNIDKFLKEYSLVKDGYLFNKRFGLLRNVKNKRKYILSKKLPLTSRLTEISKTRATLKAKILLKNGKEVIVSVPKWIDENTWLKKKVFRAIPNITEYKLIRKSNFRIVDGYVVGQRSEIFTKNFLCEVVKDGKTNLELMRDGKAPLYNGKELQLHHFKQWVDGFWKELSKYKWGTPNLVLELLPHEHPGNVKTLHGYVDETKVRKTKFQENQWKAWKRRYWKRRALEFSEIVCK